MFAKEKGKYRHYPSIIIILHCYPPRGDIQSSLFSSVLLLVLLVLAQDSFLCAPKNKSHESCLFVSHRGPPFIVIPVMLLLLLLFLYSKPSCSLLVCVGCPRFEILQQKYRNFRVPFDTQTESRRHPSPNKNKKERMNDVRCSGINKSLPLKKNK